MKELRHLNKYFRTYRFKLLLGVIITIVARLFSLIMPSYVSKSIDTISALTDNLIEREEAKSLLFEYILIIFGAAILSGLFTFLMRQTIINVSRYIEYDLKNEIFDHYQLLGSNFYKRNRIGDLMNRISEDVTQVRMYGGPVIMYGINTLTTFVFVISLMFIKAPTIAFYTLIPLPILSILIYQMKN